MNKFFSVKEVLISGYTVQSLEILSVIALLLSIAVIINKNPIGSLFYLIGLFGSISVYLILSGLTFIGFSYLIVYIGAVYLHIIRFFWSKNAAWVKISLYKVDLIRKIFIKNWAQNSLFIYNTEANTVSWLLWRRQGYS